MSYENDPADTTNVLLDPSLRPLTLADFTGQRHVRENLTVFIQAALSRQEALDHILLYGPPGLGKTTLAQIIAKELNVGFKATSGPVIAKAGDLAAILTNLAPKDVLFIDEIHRLNPIIEEILYPAMEDLKLDIMIGEGPAARSLRLDIAPFTLIGATTRAGLLTQPLRERFGIPLRLEFYEINDLAAIIMRASRLLSWQISHDAALEIAHRSRGTPRIAGRLLRRVRDFSNVYKMDNADLAFTVMALDRLNVDKLGLDQHDIRFLKLIADYYGGGPVGVETLAAALAEQRDTLEEVVEPYLIQRGLLSRTARGRVLTALAYTHLGLEAPFPRQQLNLDGS